MLSTRAITAIAVMLTMSGAALAQGAGQGPVGQSCSGDIAKLCAGKEHGGGAVRACLEANKAKLSAACKSALENTGPGRGMGGMGGMGGRM